MKVCTACEAENDDTRIFCLNCRERLPQAQPGSPSGSIQTSAGASAPPLPSGVIAKKPAPRKIPQARRRLSSLIWTFLVLGVLSGLVFAIYLVAQRPDDISPPVQKDAAASAALASFFQKASVTPGGAWMGSEDSINRFLLENVHLVPVSAPLGLHTEFKRCYVELRDGRLDFVMEESLQGHPLYFSLVLEPYSVDGDLKVRFVGASLGKLPVPARLVPFLIGIWRPCFDSLGAIMDALDSASAASVTPKNLVIRWPGKRRL
ncbi:MAG: hypothetical protein WCG66_05705 [bacterium]